MPNAVRTVHKAEIIRLYEGACDQMNHIKVTGRPSTTTLWNILQNCQASQRKSLSGLDNIAADGTDASDCLISKMKFVLSKNTDMKDKIDEVIKPLTIGKRYLKGEYKSNCAAKERSEIPDHCPTFALSDSREKLFLKICKHQHNKKYRNCEHLKKTLNSSEIIIQNAELSEKERSDYLYDFHESRKNIECWKAHILTVVHQEEQKTKNN